MANTLGSYDYSTLQQMVNSQNAQNAANGSLMVNPSTGRLMASMTSTSSGTAGQTWTTTVSAAAGNYYGNQTMKYYASVEEEAKPRQRMVTADGLLGAVDGLLHTIKALRSGV
jgi:hypothetical protein